MRELFYENQFRLTEQDRLLTDERNYHAKLSNPYLDPLTDLSLEAFSGYETPDAVKAFLVDRSEALEADFQLDIARNALLKVRAALRVVESQTSLSMQVRPREEELLLACLETDKRQIRKLFEKASAAVCKAQGNKKAAPSLKEELTPLVIKTNTDFVNIGHRLINPDVLAMDHSELIEKVAEDRLECVKLVLNANEKHFQKINRQLNEAAYIIKAIDENMVQDIEASEEQVVSRLSETDQAMDKCSRRIETSRRYMEEVSEMGLHASNLGANAIKRFVPIRYHCAPMSMLFEIGS